MATIIEGTIAFQALNKTDVYNGQDTGKYNVTLRLPEEFADTLEAAGVKLKEYEGVPQRKFTSKFKPELYTADGQPYSGSVPNGSKVRIVASYGKPSPMHGTPTYFTKLKVLEFAEGAQAEVAGGEF